MDSRRSQITSSLLEIRELFSIRSFSQNALSEIESRVQEIAPYISVAAGTEDKEIIARIIHDLMNSEQSRHAFYQMRGA